MKRIIMHNRTQSEDVLRPQAFSRAQVRPRNHRLTLANLERLPVPEPPQVTTKSDLGSIESRSSSERSRNKLEAIRLRELEFAEEDEEDDGEDARKKEQEEREEAQRKQALEEARIRLREQARIQQRKASPSQSRKSESKEPGQERSRSRTKSAEPITAESKLASKERIEEPMAPALPAPVSKQRAAEPIPAPALEPSVAPTHQSETASSKGEAAVPPADAQRLHRYASRPPARPVEAEEGSDLIRIRNMGNHLKSLSANLEDVRTGMDNITKLTGKPQNGTAGGETLVHMTDQQVFEAVSRGLWASLWIAHRDTDSWKGFNTGPGLWLLLLLAVPLYALFECISCMIWCRPVFADSMEGLGVYPDAPEMPFVIPTMLLRPLRPMWKPAFQMLCPVVHWMWNFMAYVTMDGKDNGL